MATREQKLRELRRVVASAPDDRLHMKDLSDKADCGTVYCALGWAVVDRWFRRNTGLSWAFRRQLFSRLIVDRFDDPTMMLGTASLEFELSHFDAMALFAFNLDDATCDRLERDPHAITKADVIANIDRLLEGEPAIPYGDTLRARATRAAVADYAYSVG